MTHAEALSKRDARYSQSHDHPYCQEELVHRSGGFWDDISWELFRCPCGDVVACVGGGIHNWNYTVTNPAILAEVSR